MRYLWIVNTFIEGPTDGLLASFQILRDLSTINRDADFFDINSLCFHRIH